MRIYLDICCLNRGFDDQTQQRIRFESEAVQTILDAVNAGEHTWIASAAVQFEIAADPNPQRRSHVGKLLQYADKILPPNASIAARGKAFENAGLGALDALHLAFAEAGNCDILLTTDDRFLRRVRHNSLSPSVRIENPVQWLLETQNGGETA